MDALVQFIQRGDKWMFRFFFFVLAYLRIAYYTPGVGRGGGGGGEEALLYHRRVNKCSRPDFLLLLLIKAGVM